MASMISYFGRIKSCKEGEQTQPSQPRWDGGQDLATNLNNRSPENQLRILFDQSLAAAYYLKFYGPRCHEVVNDFIAELNADICFRFSRKFASQLQGNYQKIYTMLLNLVKFNRGGNWSDVDLALVDEFMFDGTVRCGEPVAFCKCKRGALIPFLMWMNKGITPNYGEVAFEKSGVVTFDFDDTEWMADHMRMCIEMRFHAIGQSFSTTRVPLDALTSCPLLAFLSHYNWAGKKFEHAVGIISEFCLHTDIERYGLSMDHHLAYCLRMGCLYPRFDLAGDHSGIEPIVSKYHQELFNALLAFVQFCTDHRAMGTADRTIIAKAFGVFAYTKEQKESVAYLNKCDATASADELKSFKRVMGSVESLQLISQSPTLVAAQTDASVTGSTEDAKTGDGQGEDTKKNEDNDQTAKKDDDPDKKKEGDEGDDSKPSDDEDGADDLDMDDTDESDTSFDASDVSGDGSSGGSSDSGSSDNDSPNTQDGGTPDDLNTSDDVGIDFVITPPEMATVDSVLFREEMYKFLSNVLTNPPKCLTPQDIATLTALKRFWLSCLSIETIKGIVEACIRLPLSIKHSIHQSTELTK